MKSGHILVWIRRFATPALAVAVLIATTNANGDDRSGAESLRAAGHSVYIDNTGSATRLLLQPRSFASAQLVDVRTLTKLVNVNASGLTLSDEDMAQLGQLASLRSLTLKDAKFSESAVAKLARLSDLEILDLSGTPTSAKSITALSVLPKLKTLRLDDTKIGDEAEKPLRALHTVRSLSLMNTSLSVAAARRLKKALRQANIHYGWDITLKEVESHMEISTPVATFVFPEAAASVDFKETKRLELFAKNRRKTTLKYGGTECYWGHEGMDVVFSVARHKIQVRDEGRTLQIGDAKFEFNTRKRTYVVAQDGKVTVPDWKAVLDSRKRYVQEKPPKEDRDDDRDYEPTIEPAEGLGIREGTLRDDKGRFLAFVVDLYFYSAERNLPESDYGATIVFDGMPIPIGFRYGHMWRGNVGIHIPKRGDGSTKAPSPTSKDAIAKRRNSFLHEQFTFVSLPEGFQFNFNDQEVIDFDIGEGEIVIRAKHALSGIELPPQKVPISDASQKVVIEGIVENARKKLADKWDKLVRERDANGQ